MPALSSLPVSALADAHEADVNDWEGLEEAVAIADAGSFAGAARILHVSNSHISKVIARLEQRLATQLFHRTTRQLRLTDTGRAFVEQSRMIIQERNQLLSAVAGTTDPQGLLQLTCSIALGERFVAPLLRGVTAHYDRLTLSIELTNRVIDIVAEGYDLAVRTGHVDDPRLIAKRIATRPVVTCASPEYLARTSALLSPDDLAGHACLIGSSPEWHFMEGERQRKLTPRGRFRCNSGVAIAEAAIDGLGICQLPRFYVQRPLESGQLVEILAPFRAAPESIWAVYPKRRHLLPKIRCVVDLLSTDLQPLLDRTQRDPMS